MLDQNSLCNLSLAEAAAQIRERRLSPVELTQACLDRITRFGRHLGAFTLITPKSALQQARQAEAEIAQDNYRGPLHGIPIAIKDIVDVAGEPTTAASGVLLNNVALADAPVIQNLRAAGAVFVGKTNLHEFAYGGSGVISHFGPVRNPRNSDYITGGSSSGSAAAVASGMCYAAIGTDTAGSIRLPAACCGIVGLKPTYGLVSTEGVVPLSWSYDHVGPMARTVRDTHLFFTAIRGSAPKEHAAVALQGIRLGVARKYFFDGLEPGVSKAVEHAIAILQRRFGQVIDINIPVDEDRTVSSAEAYAYHLQFLDKHADQYQPPTLARIKSGERVTAPQYILKLRELENMRRDAAKIFTNIDVVVTPTTPIGPPRMAGLLEDLANLRAHELMMLRNTRPFNVLGLPTITVPCGRDDNGLPVGVQFSGPPYGEEAVLAVAEAFEQIRDL